MIHSLAWVWWIRSTPPILWWVLLFDHCTPPSRVWVPYRKNRPTKQRWFSISTQGFPLNCRQHNKISAGVSRDLGHTKGPCCNIFLPCTRNNLLSTTLTFSQMPGRGAHPLLPSPGEAFLHHLLNWPDYLKRPPEPLEIINSLTVLGIGLNNSTEKKKNLIMLLKKKKKKKSSFQICQNVASQPWRILLLKK